MHVVKLRLKNFRNYDELELEPSPGINIIVGPNGAGKTNILEAVYMLASGRSHRTHLWDDVIKWGKQEASLAVKIKDKSGEQREIEIFCEVSGKKRLKIDGLEQNRLSDLMGILRAVIFAPEDLTLVKGPPLVRRRFLDMEISQVSPLYYRDLLEYNRVLKQRNKLLGEISLGRQNEELLAVFDDQLVPLGVRIAKRRQEIVNRLGLYAGEIHRKLSGEREYLTIDYDTAVSKGEEVFRKKLRGRRRQEIRRGITTVGPHRDDLVFRISGRDTRSYASQGQQRTVALAIRLASLRFIKEDTAEDPVLLLDDVFSELDAERRKYLLDIIDNDNQQTFITGAHYREFPDSFLEHKTFEVGQG